MDIAQYLVLVGIINEQSISKRQICIDLTPNFNILFRFHEHPIFREHPIFHIPFLNLEVLHQYLNKIL